MFSFFQKKSAPDLDFGFLGVDMHSHILPGIDDGAPDLETSLALIRGLQDMGYHKLIATPHIYKDLYPNTIQTIQAALVLVQHAVQEAGIDVEIESAAEYFLDEHFRYLLSRDELLLLPEQHILFEMSFLAPYPQLHEVIFEMRTKGYQPVLAHPERYLYYGGDLEQFEQIRHYGCKLQLNILSLSGYYGRESQKLAQRLLDQGWVDLLGTDLHHQRHQEHLKAWPKDQKLMQKVQRNEFLNKTWNF